MNDQQFGKLSSIFEKIASRRYDSTCCFLCGTELTSVNSTEEHVFPAWIQKRYSLWNQTLTLVNQSTIPYRSLRIACCADCNNIYLSQLENKIKEHVEGGYSQFLHLGKETIFCWLGKILYGILIKEANLSLDRGDMSQGTILTPEFVDEFRSHALFLQGIRGMHKFADGLPASIFVLELQSPADPTFQWDFFDNLPCFVIAVRMGDVGVIGVMQDGGVIEANKETYAEFFKVRLHPIQFRELMALVTYQVSLLNRTPKFISYNKENLVETLMMPLSGLSGSPMFNEWDGQEYAKLLAFYTNQPLDKINPSPNKVMTWIKDDNGRVRFIDFQEHPYL